MSDHQVQITLSTDELAELLRAYKLLGEFLDSVLPKELIYKEAFRRGLEKALDEDGVTTDQHG